MKKFKDWYKGVTGVEPDYETAQDKISWCMKRDLPVITSCIHCERTLVIFSAFMDDEGYTYCRSCAGE